MQRRQEVLGSIEQAIIKENESIMSMENEISGFKTALNRLNVENESLQSLYDKLLAESNMLTSQIKTLDERRDILKQQYGNVQKLLDSCETDLKGVMQHRQTLTNEINGLKKKITSFQQKSIKIEKEIADQIQLQLGIEKSMSGTLKDARKITQSIHEKQSIIATCENQVAALKLEGYTSGNTIQQLREELKQFDETIHAKNSTIERYELEIRRSNDEMAKKQSEIDLLNKKLNQILTKSVEEALGPLEATIHNLTKSLASKERECWDLQQFWLRNQNELVVTLKRSNETAEHISTSKMKLTILNRKKAALNQEFDNEEGEIKVHQRNIKALQNEMIKINTLVSKQSNLQAELEESNLGLEQEFRYRLKVYISINSARLCVRLILHCILS
jgi:chromosome segregation ATPase